jgi:choline dehydrogenase-like flavoprotein
VIRQLVRTGLPAPEVYDYIVVGAGSAGCVLVARLAENPLNRILLIEEGPSGPDWLVDMPRGYGQLLLDSRYTKRFPVTHGSRDELWLRGSLLGGCSSINGTVWLRGVAADYDAYANHGLHGWSWADMLPAFKALESHETGEGPLHGGSGPVPVCTPPFKSRMARALIERGQVMGLPERPDANGTEGEGIGFVQHNIRHGRRVGAKRAFLDPAMRRDNVRVITGARVDRVLFEQGCARGVTAVLDGQTAQFFARAEIILAAGALESPAVLQRSGIGDGELLRRLGIPLVRHSPVVGRNLQEHMTVSLQFRTRHRRDSDNHRLSGLRLAGNVLRYLALRSGPLASGAHQVGVSLRSDPIEPRPDLRVMFAPFSRLQGGSRRLEPEPGVNLIGFVLRPESRGDLVIRKADPQVGPLIRPNYLATGNDRRRNIALVRAMRQLMGGPKIEALMVGETAPTAGAQSDEEILEMIQAIGAPGFHTTSTCAAGDQEAVLDAKLRVRGVTGLRVADCSVFPAIISGHMHAAAMAVGWRVAGMILEEQAA